MNRFFISHNNIDRLFYAHPVNRALLALALITLAQFASAESVTPADIVAGKPIPASTSPDGKLCLLEVFHDSSTQNSVIFATTDRKENLGYADIFTEWSTDRPHKGRTTVDPEIPTAPAQPSTTQSPSTAQFPFIAALATASSGLETHDILVAACGHWGVSRVRVVSSGQRPLRWPAGDIVTVEVSVRLKDGKQLRRSFPIHAPLKANPFSSEHFNSIS